MAFEPIDFRAPFSVVSDQPASFERVNQLFSLERRAFQDADHGGAQIALAPHVA